ncbi:MAG: alkyl/aryl-sulfatase [Alphaproteobacteria bacterium]|nr:alkyl/aryl-sulfatase [Alphaproteobacteria bacterium]
MPHPDLIAHAEQTRKDIVELSPGIWTAVGYAASNVHMIEGESSVTIIDTTESTKAAENIAAEFRKLTEKPIRRIIYTHSHRDHISGASVFSDGSVPIHASHRFRSDLIAVDPDRIAPTKSLGRRTQAQFGIGLKADERISLGCGPGDRPMEGLGAGYLAPTDWVTKDSDIDLDGVPARLMHVPGETADHLVVWLPETEVLFCGDNWYHAFPNLYAIRGTPYRDFAAWADGLASLAGLNAKVLAPGHTWPVFGKDDVRDVLTTTREAILHVMRVTADGMDRGLSLDDIADAIALPPDLADKPWLKEFYGKAAWSARAFAAGTLGWYDGNPTHLGTLSSAGRARKMAELAGGTDALMRAAETTDDLQWKLELCDHLIALGEPAMTLKAETTRPERKR